MVANEVRVAEVAKHVWVVALSGEHDLSTAGEVGAAVDRVFNAGSNLVLDLSGATFIDSSVLAAVLRAQARADAGRDDELVVVAPAGSRARRTLELARIDASVRLSESRTAAIEGFTYR
jgi:anti-sigma B factor antagonist